VDDGQVMVRFQAGASFFLALEPTLFLVFRESGSAFFVGKATGT
jgi:hypothetical protein